MKNLDKLLKKIKENPQNGPKTIKKLFDELGDAMKGTVTFDVPKKYAGLFEAFASGKDGEKDLEKFKDLVPKKGINVKTLSADIKKAIEGGDVQSVKLDLGKVKKVVLKDVDNAFADVKKEGAEDEDGEPGSLFQEVAGEEVLVASVIGAYGVFALIGIAMFVYVIWIIVKCIQNKTISVFEDESWVGGVVISVILFFGFSGFIWALLMHLKFRKAEKVGSSKNEEAEDDSVLSGMPMTEFATGEEALTAVDGNDQELLNAYRLVLSDLKHRSPNGTVPDPLKEGGEDIDSKDDVFQVEGNSSDLYSEGDSILDQMNEKADVDKNTDIKDKRFFDFKPHEMRQLGLNGLNWDKVAKSHRDGLCSGAIDSLKWAEIFKQFYAPGGKWAL